MVRDENNELQEALDMLDMGHFLEHEGIEYREKTGSSDDQYNLHYCPACGDSKWRVWMNQETGLGNCFHGDCHVKTFNKYSFIREYLDNPPAKDVVAYIKRVSADMGWKPKRKAKAPVVTVLKEAELPTGCINLPDVNGNNLAYLDERGIDGKLAKEFRLMYCENGSFFYESSIREREEQFYGKRVIIPVFDLHGQMVTFQGRDILGTSSRKYLFPPGLPSSGRYLYGGHLVKGKAELAIGEGVFDAIALTAAFRTDPDLAEVGAVATFGMHLSDDGADGQVSYFMTLKRMGLKRVTFFWDSEKRAIKNAMEAAEKLSKLGLTARVAILPPDQDPNESSSDQIIYSYYNAHDLKAPAGRRELLRKIL